MNSSIQVQATPRVSSTSLLHGMMNSSRKSTVSARQDRRIIHSAKSEKEKTTDSTSATQGEHVTAEQKIFLFISHEAKKGKRFGKRSAPSRLVKEEVVVQTSEQRGSWIKCSMGDKKPNIRRVCERLGREICETLPSLHATGCDSVSAFSTKGKKKALDVVQMNPALRQTLGSLGERVPARQDDLNKLERFVCALYNDHLCQSVNELRYKLFCKSKSLQSHQLPPTKEALKTISSVLTTSHSSGSMPYKQK
ncbi:hypothetical protein pdam_00024645 [Pocillopora damicornis]|uniref:Uncharacterized protein n=1 Tax=Pocillopora damicornis TaxID=46731 RepID=A0A3M6UQH2_POCDA|nr:hypothetical protein pdam_00024645 [Pocillopora damicornis]